MSKLRKMRRPQQSLRQLNFCSQGRIHRLLMYICISMPRQLVMALWAKSNLIQTRTTKFSARQWSARVLMSISAKENTGQWYGYHVPRTPRASMERICGFISRNGRQWMVATRSCCAPQWVTSATLFWQIGLGCRCAPTNEIPTLEEVLVNSTPQPGHFCFDDTLKSAQEFEDGLQMGWPNHICFGKRLYVRARSSFCLETSVHVQGKQS